MSDRLPKILRTRGAVERGRDTVAPDLTYDEAVTVAWFDAAPDAPESLRERVARAIFFADGWTADEWHRQSRYYLILADAAIAVCRGDV